MTAKPKVLDLFAGCGGFSLGFERAGYEIAAFVEWWDPAIQTFQRNHPNAVLLGRDITKISDEKACAYHNAIDVLIGGPPCQGFSLC
ncbi:MAG: DNA cytosine methyltransferase, partial [Candidatus Nanoarchaeia archaeon]